MQEPPAELPVGAYPLMIVRRTSTHSEPERGKTERGENR
jgi:hypothetical protein